MSENPHFSISESVERPVFKFTICDARTSERKSLTAEPISATTADEAFEIFSQTNDLNREEVTISQS